MVWNATDDADSYVRATAVHVIGSLACQLQLWISLLQISHLTEVLSNRNRGNKQGRRNRNPALLPSPQGKKKTPGLSCSSSSSSSIFIYTRNRIILHGLPRNRV